MKARICLLLLAASLPLWSQSTAECRDDAEAAMYLRSKLDAARALLDLEGQVLNECIEAKTCLKEFKGHEAALRLALDRYER